MPAQRPDDIEQRADAGTGLPSFQRGNRSLTKPDKFGERGLAKASRLSFPPDERAKLPGTTSSAVG